MPFSWLRKKVVTTLIVRFNLVIFLENLMFILWLYWYFKVNMDITTAWRHVVRNVNLNPELCDYKIGLLLHQKSLTIIWSNCFHSWSRCHMTLHNTLILHNMQFIACNMNVVHNKYTYSKWTTILVSPTYNFHCSCYTYSTENYYYTVRPTLYTNSIYYIYIYSDRLTGPNDCTNLNNFSISYLLPSGYDLYGTILKLVLPYHRLDKLQKLHVP